MVNEVLKALRHGGIVISGTGGRDALAGYLRYLSDLGVDLMGHRDARGSACGSVDGGGCGCGSGGCGSHEEPAPSAGGCGCCGGHDEPKEEQGGCCGGHDEPEPVVEEAPAGGCGCGAGGCGSK